MTNTSPGFFLNLEQRTAAPYDAALQSILSLQGARAAQAAIAAWDGYAPTPLRSLEFIAAECKIASVSYKDEGHRFALKAFKGLGGAYAVERLVNRLGRTGLTVTCATDGNHGRAVAWGARRAGIKAVIYVHETVSSGRAGAIAALGATVVREGRTYDDAVRASTAAAAKNGWHIVSDTSWPGYEDVPKDVMQGYAVMAMEAAAQAASPTHVFVQGGVGGLAAALLSYYWETHGASRPIFTVVEPVTAACLFDSARAHTLRTVGGDLETIMAGLACGEPSILAWQILQPGADAFMTITDAMAAQSMRDLADHGIVGGESGVAGLAGFRHAAADPAMRAALRINEQSRVLVFGTEGATDAAVYRDIVGKSAEEIIKAGSPS
ncbi:MAG: diaminopropionate ammonia-lyase [Beijerinckiaceae bacterium]